MANLLDALTIGYVPLSAVDGRLPKVTLTSGWTAKTPPRSPIGWRHVGPPRAPDRATPCGRGDEDEGFGAFSPQLPGFACGRPTLTEFKSELAGAVRFAGGARQVRLHMEKHTWDEAGREVVVRWADDEHREERLEVAQRIHAALTVSEQGERLLDSATDRAGAVVFVCAVAADTLGRFADQLDEAGDALVIAVAVADQLIWTSQLGSTGAHPDWVSLASMGASLETTVGEWVRIVGAQRSGSKVVVSV